MLLNGARKDTNKLKVNATDKKEIVTINWWLFLMPKKEFCLRRDFQTYYFINIDGKGEGN